MKDTVQVGVSGGIFIYSSLHTAYLKSISAIKLMMGNVDEKTLLQYSTVITKISHPSPNKNAKGGIKVWQELGDREQRGRTRS